jgi:hypothetical protein
MASFNGKKEKLFLGGFVLKHQTGAFLPSNRKLADQSMQTFMSRGGWSGQESLEGSGRGSP